MKSNALLVALNFCRTVFVVFLFCNPCHGQTTTSLSGTVKDPSGGLIPGVDVTLLNRDTGTSRQTRTDGLGSFTFAGIPVGLYDLKVSIAGFREQTIAGIRAATGSAVSINVIMGTSAGPPPPPPPTPAPPPPSHGQGRPCAACHSEGQGSQSFTDPIWNAWAENYSSTTSFQPVTLQVNKDYSLIIDLAAIAFSSSSAGVYSKVASGSFSSWLSNNKNIDAADVDMIILPDRRYFRPQFPKENIKSLHIDLKNIRAAQDKGFSLAGSPLQVLHDQQGQAPFNFGTQSFRIRTGSTPGTGTIALSVWVNGTPIDEMSVKLCITSNANSTCSTTPIDIGSFEGVDLSGRSSYPDVAIHLIDRQVDVVGVYRCNSCNWDRYDYRTWEIEQTGEWFANTAKGVLDLMTQSPNPASGVTKLKNFEQAGDNIYNMFFDPSDHTSQAIAVKSALASFVASARSAIQNHKHPPSLFVRLIENHPDLVLAPVGLMRVPLSDDSKEFIGYYVDVQSPLEYQDYTRPTVCVSNWVLFVPPDKTPSVPDSLTEVSDARAKFAGWISKFKSLCTSCVKDNESEFQSWLASSAPPRGDAILVLSHQNANSLFFYDGGSPAIQSTSIVRSFGAPSFVLLDGCGTAEPGASEFIRKFNTLGVNSVIATSTEVEPFMAGTFLSTFMDLLESHVQDISYTVSNARFDAVQAVRMLKDENGIEYGPRALAFIFAGNGALRACVPATGTP